MKAIHISELDGTLADGIIVSAKRGDFTLPADLLDAHTKAQELITKHADRRGYFTDATAAKDCQQLSSHIAQRFSYGNAETLLVNHLQPAVAELLAAFSKDVKDAGRWANADSASFDMLTEPQATRTALVRLHCDYWPRYASQRAAWEFLYSRGSTDALDPLGARSPLTEVGNLPDLHADWQASANGRKPWPWTIGGQSFLTKHAWILANGGEVWMPTRAQHRQAWIKYNPNAVIRDAA